MSDTFDLRSPFLRDLLDDTAESESRGSKEPKDLKDSKVLKVDLYKAQDLLAIGKSIGDRYVYNKFQPLDPELPVRMVTYCLLADSTFLVLLRNVNSPEPVVICPAYFAKPDGYPPLINVLVRGNIR